MAFSGVILRVLLFGRRPLLSEALLCLAGFIAVVLIIVAFRKWWKVRVSCWFCHADVRVPFRMRNCWDCPHCDQYNGFTETGDYNKTISAMYEEEPEKRFTNLRSRYSPPPTQEITALDARSGLCSRCNDNQTLKIRQLANFVPTCEESYDDELSTFRRRLEQIYALCSNCQKIVRTELTNQSTKFGHPLNGLNGGTKIVRPSRKNLSNSNNHYRHQRRDSASPGRVGSLLSTLSLGGRSENCDSRRRTVNPISPSKFQMMSPSSQTSSSANSSFNEQSYLWPSRFPASKKNLFNGTNNDDCVSVFSSISQKYRHGRSKAQGEVNCYQSSNFSGDFFWKSFMCLVLVCSFSTNAVVLYILLTRG